MDQMQQQYQSIQLLKGSPIQEEHLEFVLSLEVVKHFSKISAVRALKPITSALEQGDSKNYKNHWSDLLRYETYLPQLDLPRVNEEHKEMSKHCIKLTMKYDPS